MNPKTFEMIKRSHFFLAIVTEHYLQDPSALEQAMLANALKKKVMLVVKEGYNVDNVKYLFKDCEIITTITLTDDSKGLAEKISEAIKKFLQSQKASN